MTFHVPEERRVTKDHPRATRPHAGMFGAFYLPGPFGVTLHCIASDGSDWQRAGLPGVPWEHVSVSCRVVQRCPNWLEMTRVKEAFWDPEDCVVQFHPPRSDYVNWHEHVLHLWRPVGVELVRPPWICVGPKDEQLLVTTR